MKIESISISIFQQIPLTSSSSQVSYSSYLTFHKTPSKFQQLPSPPSSSHLHLQLLQHLFLLLSLHSIWLNYKFHESVTIAKHVSLRMNNDFVNMKKSQNIRYGKDINLPIWTSPEKPSFVSSILAMEGHHTTMTHTNFSLDDYSHKWSEKKYIC